MNVLSQEVIELLNRKQEAAFEVLFSLYYPRLVYFAKEYVPYEDAKNLVQDAFVSFWEKNPPLYSEPQLQSYLYTVVKNNCLMRLRHEKLEKRYSELAELKLQKDLHLLALEQLDTTEGAFREIETIIGKTLSQLPGKCREVFLLSRMEGRKNHEIALALDISDKAVEAHITRAIKSFRVALRDFLPLVSFWILS
ncbi:MAG TPA: RNA polymerase sigma-70 factor [Prolixibacteraceae bacterium]|nr:RNA polymerase sigma-70 factor [Prolixibacteraceae bacterium]